MLELLKKWLAPIDARRGTCACCGRCCELFGGHLNACDADIHRWKREGREDLVKMVNRFGWIWVDPDTQKPLNICPFIERAETGLTLCRINHTKPDMCRDFPRIEIGQSCVRVKAKDTPAGKAGTAHRRVYIRNINIHIFPHSHALRGNETRSLSNFALPLSNIICKLIFYMI